MPAFVAFVLPELRALPASERTRALRHAFGEPFDAAELLALAVALLGATASLAAGAFVAALVLLRRTRRSLSGRIA